MMVMIHNNDKRCPFCYSKRLVVNDYGLSEPRFHEKLGKFWFELKCKNCGGLCEDINNLDSSEKREARKQKKEAV